MLGGVLEPQLGRREPRSEYASAMFRSLDTRRMSMLLATTTDASDIPSYKDSRSYCWGKGDNGHHHKTGGTMMSTSFSVYPHST